MAATIDQVLAAVSALNAAVGRANSKLDMLLTGQGLQMALEDDIEGATATLTAEVATLNTAHDQLAALIAQLQQQIADGNVNPAIVSQFETALGTLKPAVDNVAALVPAAPPAG
jgi:prefoldin subunit 5